MTRKQHQVNPVQEFEDVKLCVFKVSKYIQPQGRGRQPPGDENFFYVHRKAFSRLILYSFFNDFIHVYSCRAGADNPLGIKFWCQEKGLITLLIFCKFQKNLFEIWFYTDFFMLLYMHIAPRQRQTIITYGQNFDGNRNILSLRSFVVSFFH